MIQFDSSVNLGQLLTLLAFIGSALLLFGAMREKLSAMADRLAHVEDEMSSQTQILVDLAKVTTRMDEQERRLGRLEGDSHMIREMQRLRQVVQVGESAERIIDR